ncbi:MAG TPA: hypothetical protein VLC79_14490 [Cellvibrio sp.]|nr:hypothetical protein [Cellvibrio sp.]
MKNYKLVLIASFCSFAFGILVAKPLFSHRWLQSFGFQEETVNGFQKNIEVPAKKISHTINQYSSSKFSSSVPDHYEEKAGQGSEAIHDPSVEKRVAPDNNNIEPLAKSISALPEQFSKEQVNETWAFERERKLQSTFAEDDRFQGKELQSVKCKSSICEIKFYSEDRQELLKTGSSLNHLIIDKLAADFKPNIMSFYSAENKTATYYFSGTN